MKKNRRKKEMKNDDKKMREIMERLDKVESMLAEMNQPPTVHVVKNVKQLGLITKQMSEHIKQGFLCEVFLRKVTK
jgi:hypothetical protein